MTPFEIHAARAGAALVRANAEFEARLREVGANPEFQKALGEASAVVERIGVAMRDGLAGAMTMGRGR